ncbi:unnamed protein product [marine sediment metagenome]|uniref:Uncharacterized protein n=1 Tax=marine sediment metagenome TaxID=412755 RepID=X1HDF6_9ZZZZ
MAKKKVSSRPKIPDNETKSERFIRVVAPRVSKAVKAIDVIGFCAGSTYEYTPDQSVQIGNALIKAVNDLRVKFDRKANKQDSFNFKP